MASQDTSISNLPAASSLVTTDVFPVTQSDGTTRKGTLSQINGIALNWVPVLTAQTPGDLSVAYTRQLGTSRKMGTVVDVWGAIVTSSLTWSTTTGSWSITGLPYTSMTLTGFAWEGKLVWSGITKANFTEIAVTLASNAATLFLGASGSGQAQTNLVAADIPSGGSLVLRWYLRYETAS